MAQTGHKTMSRLGRYRKVDRGDLKALGEEKPVTIFTDIFTSGFSKVRREGMRANYLK